jgi:predicted AlkP superfamily phosphohydrolase/phosphomutase
MRPGAPPHAPRSPWRRVGLSAAATLGFGLGLLPACDTPPPAGPGVFVLGVDGMDPVILRRLIDAGRMPNLAKLAANGSFQELGTSNPPQSPVAWSNFVTGEDPGGHGIYDFVHRDPKTYLPTSSATPAPGEPPSSIDVFGYYLPIGGDDVVNNRSGTPWWDSLHGAGVDVEVYRIPGNYPPTPSEARTLSGMGTVDMRGGYGIYSWFTDQAVTSKEALKGDIQLVTVEDYDLDGKGDTVKGKLKGAPDIFHLPPGQIPTESDYLTAAFTVSIDPTEDVAFIRFGSPGDGGAEALLREGEWTDWMNVSFDALPAGALPLAGAVRFYAKELRPAFKLYASPVNMSAEEPPQPISTPDEFAPDLALAVGGGFYTQGMPEETNALRDGTFTDDDYERQVHLVMEDAERMLSVALDRFQPGDATFFYLSDIDLQCHMLWRHGDPKQPGGLAHPAYEPESAQAHADDIDGYYENVDRLVGKIVSGLPADSLLLVMSDHGFQPFTRKVHLNSWLRDNGYLTLKDGKREGHIAHGDVDWSKTRAYALGFNAIYLNLQGRERDGIVSPAEAGKTMAELQAALTAFTDPKDGAKVVLRVDRGADIYHGARVSESPDLVVGYDRGYGHSDESTLGELPEAELEDNTSKWSGNHLMAPEVVPGVLLSSRPLQGSGYDLTDVTATLYAWYGLAPHAGMIGQPILTP